MAPTSPTVASWAIGLRLRERREEAGLSGSVVGKRAGVTGAYLSEVEQGKKKLTEERLAALVEVLELDRDEADELQTLRQQGAQRGWWSAYSALFGEELMRFFGYEHGAESLRSYDSGIMNGLFQTEDYARAIIEAGSPNIRLAEVDRRVQCRMTRQNRVTGKGPLQISAVMSEAVLRQHIGTARILADQLKHLADLIEKHADTLEVQVVPFDAAGGHPAMGGSAFHLMTFPSGKLPTALWQETVSSTSLITDPMTVREYSLAQAEAAKASLSREDTLALIREVFGQLCRRHTVET